MKLRIASIFALIGLVGVALVGGQEQPPVTGGAKRPYALYRVPLAIAGYHVFPRGK